jgi:hypothetical protein
MIASVWCDPSDGSDHTFNDDCGCRVKSTPEMMQEFFEEAFLNGYEIPLPVFVTDETLVKLDAFIEEYKLDG